MTHNPNFPSTAKINRSGVLEIGGCDVKGLAEEFGTPLYVMDEKTLREKCAHYRDSFRAVYQNTQVIFACKALCTSGILRIIADEGLGADVVSGGELYTALRAGVDPGKIYFHGNNKTPVEIEEAVRAKVGKIVIDNINEIRIVNEIAGIGKRTQEVLIRINPGIEAHTHEFIRTGQVDSKFGVAKDQVLSAISEIVKSGHLKFAGLHAHIGSQIFDLASFAADVDILLELAARIHDQLKVEIPEINIGGGLGVDYLEKNEAPAIDALAEVISSRINSALRGLGIGQPRLVLEPGRSIVANAGVTLYTIGITKEVPGVRKYVMIDGGMSDNPRPILYQAKYDAVVANRAAQPRNEKVTVAGRFCESGDVLLKDIMLQKHEPGDIICVFGTGAYNYSMSSNYNRVPRPAMVLVNDGSASLIVGRETYEDLVAKDVVL